MAMGRSSVKRRAGYAMKTMGMGRSSVDVRWRTMARGRSIVNRRITRSIVEIKGDSSVRLTLPDFELLLIDGGGSRAACRRQAVGGGRGTSACCCRPEVEVMG
jgi:hypothetical protein